MSEELIALTKALDVDDPVDELSCGILFTAYTGEDINSASDDVFMATVALLEGSGLVDVSNGYTKLLPAGLDRLIQLLKDNAISPKAKPIVDKYISTSLEMYILYKSITLNYEPVDMSTILDERGYVSMELLTDQLSFTSKGLRDFFSMGKEVKEAVLNHLEKKSKGL